MATEKRGGKYSRIELCSLADLLWVNDTLAVGSLAAQAGPVWRCLDAAHLGLVAGLARNGTATGTRKWARREAGRVGRQVCRGWQYRGHGGLMMMMVVVVVVVVVIA